MKYKIFYGGWYQRTTLHLSEIYDFLHKGISKLPLDQNQLDAFRKSLDVSTCTRENGYLEYVHATNGNGISIKYYEDGLYLLEFDSDDIELSREKLKNYYLNTLNPAVSYIFSLGAPTPKVLANIKLEHPTVVVVQTKSPKDYKVDESIFGEVYSTINSDKFTVFKTANYIVLAVTKTQFKDASNLVEMQIFFREFKDQLEKYLNIHRTIWEEITHIKDSGSIKGSEIVKNRSKLDSYDRTISIINNRINQMGSYIKTRQVISSELGLEEHLQKVFDYKFETLVNTLTYIKEVWSMTRDYVKNVLSVLTDIENQSLNNSIKSLQLITSIGVVSGIMGYLSKTELPRFTSAGWQYLIILLLSTFLVNLVIIAYYRSIKYKVKISDTLKI